MIFKKFSQGEGMKNEQGNHLIFSVVVFDSGDQTIASSCKSCQKNGDNKFLDS